MGTTAVIRNTMRLFGIPYQFTDAVDPRYPTVNPNVGEHFVKNIMTEGPVVTFIPGVPDYLPAEGSTDKKVTTTAALLEGAGGFSNLKEAINRSGFKDYRLYDFKRDYSHYMTYVNILCRAGATFLELDEKLDGVSLRHYDWRNYRWDGSSYSSIIGSLGATAANALKNAVWKSDAETLSETLTKLQKNKTKYEKEKAEQEKKLKNTKKKAQKDKINKKIKQLDTKIKNLKKDIKDTKKKIESSKNTTSDATSTSEAATAEDQSSALSEANSGNGFIYSTMTDDEDLISQMEDALQTKNFIQFYVDPQSGMDETLNNSTGESAMKGMFESSGGLIKDLAFMANSGGIDANKIQELAGEAGGVIESSLQKTIGGNSIGSALTRLVGLGNETLKGNNIIMPDIYQSTEYLKSYNITIHLKSPYGTKLGYYMNVFVPMMHLFALALPRQATANSFASPFLVKAYIEGCLTCNMGIVTSISVSRRDDSWSTDGLPTEVDVSLSIADLYSDLMMSPQTNPILFVNNPSLVEFLATNCGLSLTSPNIAKKLAMYSDLSINSFKDIGKNLKHTITETIDNFIIQNYLLTS